MKYCGLDAKAEVVYPENDKRFKGKTFKQYKQIAEKLKPGEEVTVAVRAADDGNLFGYGPVGMEKDGRYFVPRILAHEY